MLALSAIPVFYMELLLGQSIRQGPISMWKICPLFKGYLHHLLETLNGVVLYGILYVLSCRCWLLCCNCVVLRVILLQHNYVLVPSFYNQLYVLSIALDVL